MCVTTWTKQNKIYVDPINFLVFTEKEIFVSLQPDKFWRTAFLISNGIFCFLVSEFLTKLTNKWHHSWRGLAPACLLTDHAAIWANNITTLTWMMLTDEFLSSGPTHCSIMTPWLSSPLSRPSRFSTDPTSAPCPVDHSTSRTGHPPSDWSVSRRTVSPVDLIWPLFFRMWWKSVVCLFFNTSFR